MAAAMRRVSARSRRVRAGSGVGAGVGRSRPGCHRRHPALRLLRETQSTQGGPVLGGRAEVEQLGHGGGARQRLARHRHAHLGGAGVRRAGTVPVAHDQLPGHEVGLGRGRRRPGLADGEGVVGEAGLGDHHQQIGVRGGHHDLFGARGARAAIHQGLVQAAQLEGEVVGHAVLGDGQPHRLPGRQGHAVPVLQVAHHGGGAGKAADGEGPGHVHVTAQGHRVGDLLGRGRTVVGDQGRGGIVGVAVGGRAGRDGHVAGDRVGRSAGLAAAAASTPAATGGSQQGRQDCDPAPARRSHTHPPARRRPSPGFAFPSADGAVGW